MLYLSKMIQVLKFQKDSNINIPSMTHKTNRQGKEKHFQQLKASHINGKYVQVTDCKSRDD